MKKLSKTVLFLMYINYTYHYFFGTSKLSNYELLSFLFLAIIVYTQKD